MNFCMEHYGWDIEYTVNKISIKSILLMMRQSKWETEGGFSLLEQEELDRRNFDEMLKENRMKIMREMIKTNVNK